MDVLDRISRTKLLTKNFSEEQKLWARILIPQEIAQVRYHPLT